MTQPAGDDDATTVFLSTATPSRNEWRLAAAIVLVSAVLFAIAAPYASVMLQPMPAFIPGYQAALVLIDGLTATTLLSQFTILRTQGLLVLAAGYLFTGAMAIAHALTFPGLFAPTGLLGAGPQSTVWLYMFWHAGFPIAVIGHARLKRRVAARAPTRSPRPAVLGAVAAALLTACALAALATAGEAALPILIADGNYTTTMLVVIGAVWALSLLALVVLWIGRPHSVLDLWLMVVMCAWLFDIALSAALNTRRFDLGFYAGRAYGLVAASTVLAIVLIATGRLYHRLAFAATRLQSTIQRYFEMSLELILVTDTRGTFVHVSPSALTILGYRPDELVGRSSADFLYPGDLDSTRTEVRRARHGKAIRLFDARYVHKDGRVVPLAWTGVWSEPERRYFFTGRDMTERIKAENQLRQAQKMEAVGQLTGGIAHDFNNLLGIVIGNLDLLREELGERDRNSVELLDEALTAALRGADVTRQLLAFSSHQPHQPKIVAPNAVVEGMAKLLARTLGGRIDVCFKLGDEIWPVMVDPALLESSLLNLAVNARDAMPAGGILTVETVNLTLDAEEAESQAELGAGEYAVIAVSDTGTGMPPEVIARVFEPFFTTKPVGKGTGLGLSMVYGFARQSGGAVRIYSEVGIGTTFRLFLPHAAGAARVAKQAAAAALPVGNETVLVVEDSDALRKVALRQLRELGYATLEASNATAALALLDSGRPIDLLLTDIVMPGGVDGHGLAARATAARPGLRVLFTSGFTAAAADAAGSVAVADRLLSKPYRKAELAQRVRAALDEVG